jgi:hypothetical protein
MIVLKPLTITDAILTDSDIAEPDSTYDMGATLWAAGTISTGQKRYKTSTHKIYEVVATPSTTDDPEVGVLATPPTWVEVASTNKYRMFNGVINEATQSATSLSVELTPGIVCDGIAAVNLVNITDVDLVIYDGDDNEIYNKNFPIFDNSLVIDWYEYFFSPIQYRTTFIAFDIPGGYFDMRAVVTFNGTNISIGELIIGNQIKIGTANHGTSWEYLDFSRKTRNDFGEFEITKRDTSESVNFDLTIEYGQASYVKRQLKEFTGRFTTPVLWVGTTDQNDVTLTYGYLERFYNTLDTPTLTKATAEVQGLI